MTGEEAEVVSEAADERNAANAIKSAISPENAKKIPHVATGKCCFLILLNVPFLRNTETDCCLTLK